MIFLVQSSCSILQEFKVPANLKSPAEHRQSKIACYKKIKELEGQIKVTEVFQGVQFFYLYR